MQQLRPIIINNLGFKIWPTNIEAQKFDSIILKIYKMIITIVFNS